MSVPGAVSNDEDRASRSVFISYASANRDRALDLCASLEARGTKCWISCRDIAPGQNYQESIVNAIQSARAMLLQFSEAANNSDEIKKELSLASRFRVPVIVARIEKVDPTDAYAYELSTRQWIDAFHDWDRVADQLVRSVAEVSKRRAGNHSPAFHPRTRRRNLIAAASLGVAALGGTAAWYLLRSDTASAHSMQVRLTPFERLSPDLAPTLPVAMRDEMISALSQDGLVTASTAAAAPPGSKPAYALGETIRRDGDKVRVIVRLTNERSGATLWSSEFTYPGSSPEKLPRWSAVEASAVVRCGLFGASTYARPLPDSTLSDYFNYCNVNGNGEVSKSLDAARKVVRQAPDFSAGWSAVANTAHSFRQRLPAGPDRDALNKEAMGAADRAISLDPSNSEAYAAKNYLLDPRDLVGREALLKKAVNARAQPCGCEHHFYGWFLSEVGRTHDAFNEYNRAMDANSLDPGASVDLGKTLLILGRSRAEAQQSFNAAADMVVDTEFLDDLKMLTAPISGDYAGALEVLRSGREPGAAPALQEALVEANEAMLSGNRAAKAKAAAALLALPDDYLSDLTITMLGALGDNRAALQKLEQMAGSGHTVRARMWLWYPSMAGAIRDPSFPSVAQRLGLMRYWKSKHLKPDVCSAKDSPSFCRLL